MKLKVIQKTNLRKVTLNITKELISLFKKSVNSYKIMQKKYF